MKKIILISLLFSISENPLYSTTIPAASLTIPAVKPGPVEILLNKFISLKIKDLQKLAGRKFSLKEKIAILVLKQKLKHKEGERSNQGQLAMIFGIGAITLLILAFLVPGTGAFFTASLISSILAIVIGSVAKKNDPSDRKAHVGKLLGWITLGLIALLVIAVAIALSSWSWY